MTNSKKKIMFSEIKEYLYYEKDLSEMEKIDFLNNLFISEHKGLQKIIYDYFYSHINSKGRIISLERFIRYNKNNTDDYLYANEYFVNNLFKKNKPLFFLDVDNTITEYGKLSEEKKRYISNFPNKERIILSTGKAYEAILDVVEACGLQNNLASCINGSVLVENQKFQMINGIGSVSKQLIDDIDKTDIQFIYYYTDGVYAKYQLNKKNTEWMQKYNEYYKINTNIEYDKVIKILTFVYEDEPDKEKIIDNIAKKHKNLVGVRTGHHCYEILKTDQHKGNTVKIISEKFNQYYRTSVGVGDSMNDLPMLDYVGVGYVVDTVSKELGQYKFKKLNKNRDIDINEILEQYK